MCPPLRESRGIAPLRLEPAAIAMPLRSARAGDLLTGDD